MRTKILVLLAAISLVLSGNALAKQPAPTGPQDYDATFNCPATVAVGQPLILNVNVVNNGPADPGVLIHIIESDFMSGGTIKVAGTVYDEIDNGKQSYTTYTYDLGSYDNPLSAGVWMDYELNLFDADSDYDSQYCTFQIVE